MCVITGLLDAWYIWVFTLKRKNKLA
jgi:hypothetical protein